MSDEMDLVQRRVEEDLRCHLRRALAKTPCATRGLCAVCDAPIPLARQHVIPGVQRCVTCQEISELKSKHYQGRLQ